MSDADRPPQPLILSLSALTVVSGVVDAVSYLGLGHVFTANMTGNIVLVGFAAAGAPGFSVAASLTALGAFVVGAAFCGRFFLGLPQSRTLLLVVMTIEAAFTAVAAVIAATAPAIGSGWARFVLIAVLAFTMGIRNAAVRHLAVRDMTTTVVTMTLTGLAADSSLAGGHNPNALNRVIGVVGMFVGALVGATFLLHASAGWALGLASAFVACTLAYFARRAPSDLGLAT